MKRLVDNFWSKPKYENQSIFVSETNYLKGHTLISFYYFIVLFIAFQSITYNTQFPSWSEIVESENLFIPQWGSKWIGYFDWEKSVRAVYLFFISSSVLGVLFWSRSKVIRLIVAIALFQYLSLVSSFGITDHYLHMIVIASIMFVLIPSKRSRTYKSDLLKVIFGLQTIILLVYSFSGFYKFVGLAKQIKWGVTSALSNTAMGLQSSKTSYFSGYEYFFQQALIDYPSQLIVALQILGFSIELISIIILFKIRFHRIWGFLLIAFHLSIALTVGPDFSIHSLLIGTFILFSPFGSREYDLTNDLAQKSKSTIKA